MKTALLVVAVLVVGGLLLWWGRPGTGAERNDGEMRSMTFNLREQSDSSQSGKATIEERNDGTKVTIELSNEPRGATEPAHIHFGSCPNPGAVKYPLNPVMNGRSETLINSSYDTVVSGGPLAVNVHESAQKLNAYVACGNLEE